MSDALRKYRARLVVDGRPELSLDDVFFIAESFIEDKTEAEALRLHTEYACMNSARRVKTDVTYRCEFVELHLAKGWVRVWPIAEGAIPLRERRSVEDEWRDLERATLPDEVGALQRAEMRKAFYAGAFSMFSLLTGGLDGGTEATELDLAYMESLNSELRRFAGGLKNA